MKRLLLLLLLILLAAGGYLFYRQLNSQSLPPSRLVNNELELASPPFDPSRFSEVLGAATSQILETGTNLLNGVTDGEAEPLINKAVEDLQGTVKDLPKKEYDKVKYEFCKDLLPSPSPEGLQ